MQGKILKTETFFCKATNKLEFKTWRAKSDKLFFYDERNNKTNWKSKGFTTPNVMKHPIVAIMCKVLWAHQKCIWTTYNSAEESKEIEKKKKKKKKRSAYDCKYKCRWQSVDTYIQQELLDLRLKDRTPTQQSRQNPWNLNE